MPEKGRGPSRCVEASAERVSPAVLPLVAALAFAVPVQTPSKPRVEAPRATIELDWQAPPSCPSADQLRERVRRYLPELDEPLAPGATPMRARAIVEDESSAHVVELRMDNAAGQSVRRFSAADCELLTDAVALVIAVTWDPVEASLVLEEGAGGEAPVAPPPPEPPPPAPREGLSPSPTPSARSSSSSASTATRPRDRGAARLGLRVFGGGGYGPTNAAFGSLGGSVAVFSRRWRALVDGRWVLPRAVRLTGTVGGRFEAWTVGGAGCFVPARGRLEFPLCAGFEAGQLRGEGLPSLASVEGARFPHAALRVIPGVSWAPLERLAVGLDLALSAPLTRAEFTVDGAVVQGVAPVGVLVVAGLELRLDPAW